MHKGLARLLSCFILDKTKRHEFITKHKEVINEYAKKPVVDAKMGQEIVKDVLKSDKPSLICRFGLTEFKVLYSYIYKHSKYKKQLQDLMSTIYPTSDKSLDKFSKMLLELTPEIDVLAVWRNKKEAKYCAQYCMENTKYVQFNTLMPFLYQENPWSSELQNKKVLVIHPFDDSIKKQYEKRKLLFKNPAVLPDFELITMKPVYVTKENMANLPYSSWFEALDVMKKQIEAYDFEIALVAAGPFGIFLAEHCKKLGKKAIHVGGALQLFFGITGQRWIDYYPDVRAIMNEHWIRPSDSEKPEGYKKIEGGCYW
ncbi:hypothetical protein IJ670_03740 [bacterium]|nr:hypothetical protein [bacterium]